TRVEHSVTTKAYPQDTDLAAGNRYHHVRVEHDRHECRDHQVDHDAREMVLNEPPPPRRCRRRGRRSIHWPQIHFHHLFSPFSSRTSAFDQVRLLVRLARLLAISHSCARHAAAATLTIAEPAWDEKTVEDFAKSERSRSR